LSSRERTLENASGRSGMLIFDEKLGAAKLKSAITIKLNGQKATVEARQNMLLSGKPKVSPEG
jgi:hypothetical protein